MADGLVELAAQKEKRDELRIEGVAIAEVINNLDLTGLGRVQVRLPWLPGMEPWARVAVPNSGIYFIPQVKDEVLVAFNQGDVRDPYIIGSLWSSLDRPPTSIPTDAVTKRIICTPLVNEIELDDLTHSITITSSIGHTIKIALDKIEISTSGGTASVALDAKGGVSIQGTSIELKAPTITIDGGKVDIKGKGTTNINGGGSCNIKAARVNINS